MDYSSQLGSVVLMKELEYSSQLESRPMVLMGELDNGFRPRCWEQRYLLKKAEIFKAAIIIALRHLMRDAEVLGEKSRDGYCSVRSWQNMKKATVTAALDHGRQ